MRLKIIPATVTIPFGTMHARCSFFSKRTTFHGFYELHESTTWWQKCIWLLIITACAAMLILFVQIQTSRYLDGPTSTRITRLKNDSQHFPLLLLRADKWTCLDADKLNRFGITSEEIQLAMSYIQGPVEYKSTIPFEEAKRSLQEKMEKLNISGVPNFLRLLSLETLDAGDSNLVDYRNFGGPFCFNEIDLLRGARRSSLGSTWQVLFKFNYSTYWQNAREVLSIVPGGNKSDEEIRNYGAYMVNIDNFMGVELEPGHFHNINSDSNIYRPLGKCYDRPVHEIYYIDACKYDCQLRANASLNATSCMKYTGDQNGFLEFTDSYRRGNVTLCFRGVINTTGQIEGDEETVFKDLTEEEIQQRDTEVWECQKMCIPRCDQWTTSWSVSTRRERDDRNKNISAVRLVFPDTKMMIVLEEVPQYEWHDLISDFGGLLGLWLGASMMSLFQIVDLCCMSLSKRKAEEIEEVSWKSMSS